MTTREEIAPGVWVIEEEPAPPPLEWAVRCPKCKARPGESCTYITTVRRWDTRWDADTRRYRDVHVLVHLAGSPTLRSHVERRMLYTRPTRKRPPITPASAARVAWAEFDRREYLAMQKWLRANHRLFEATR